MASTMQRIGITDVKITYFRPSANGREIWGKLVPFGYQSFTIGDTPGTPGPRIAPWRTGANAAPVLEITDDLQINNTNIKKGKYAMFIVPLENGDAEMVISSIWDQLGSFFYKEEFELPCPQCFLLLYPHFNDRTSF